MRYRGLSSLNTIDLTGAGTLFHANMEALFVRSKMYTLAPLNIEPWCNLYCLFSLSLKFWRAQNTGGMN
jgi:hypothetical protein